MMVTPETLNKLGQCFANSDEVQQFIVQMDNLAHEMVFSEQMRNRVSEKDSVLVLLRQVAVFTLFCREHMELVQQLVKNCVTEEISEEELKKLMGKE